MCCQTQTGRRQRRRFTFDSKSSCRNVPPQRLHNRTGDCSCTAGRTTSPGRRVSNTVEHHRTTGQRPMSWGSYSGNTRTIVRSMSQLHCTWYGTLCHQLCQRHRGNTCFHTWICNFRNRYYLCPTVLANWEPASKVGVFLPKLRRFSLNSRFWLFSPQNLKKYTNLRYLVITWISWSCVCDWIKLLTISLVSSC